VFINITCYLLLLLQPLQLFWMTTTMTDGDKQYWANNSAVCFGVRSFETTEDHQCQRSLQICISVACTILQAMNSGMLLYCVQWNSRVIVYVWQLSSFSARLVNGSSRRKSGPRTTEDLLGCMWNAVRSNNGIMVRSCYLVCQLCISDMCRVLWTRLQHGDTLLRIQYVCEY